MADRNTRNNPRFRSLLGTFCEQFNAVFVNAQFCISFFLQEEERSPPAIFPHATFAFTILVVLGLLQVKYQGKNKTPFESQPITIAIAIISFLIYGFAYGIEQRLTSRHRNRIPSRAINTTRCCMLLAGSVSLATTTSFLFPDSFQPVIFLFYSVASGGELLYWLHHQRVFREYRESCPGWLRCQQIFMKIWRFIVGRSFTQQRQLLPQ